MARTTSAAVLAFAAALGGMAAALAGAGALGAFDRTVTTVQAPTRVQQPAVLTSPATRPPPALDAVRLYAARSPGVVTLESAFDGEPAVIATGSGFVVDAARGLILTNSHVVTNSADATTPAAVRKADHVYVSLDDGERADASVVGFDLFDDVAVVRTDPRAIHLVAVPLGSSQSVRVGEPVAAIGSPFDEPGSLSVGVVSQVGRQIPAPAGVCFLTAGAIQTDAAINHGNSGGPLFDAAGRVIGINAQIDSTGSGGQGVGFAVPIDAARRSLRQILASGHAQYAWLGVLTELTVTPSFAQRFDLEAASGALVGGVAPSSPAAAAGLRAGTRVASYAGKDVHPDGDVIVQLGRYPVRSLDGLQTAVARYAPGQAIRVRYWRGGDERTATLRLAARPLSPAGGCDALDRR